MCTIQLALKVTQISVLLVLFSLQSFASSYSIDLNGSWSLRRDDGKQVLQGSVPGYVQTAMMESGLLRSLEDESIQWISEHGWIYSSPVFDVPMHMQEQSKLELVFEGLDTYATVYVNGVEVLRADNYFRSWRVDVKDQLYPTNNFIEVHLDSPYVHGDRLLAMQAHPLPGEGIRAVARKPQYHYGWDWGPNITPMGIHGAVRLEAWSHFQVRGASVETLAIEEGRANMRLHIDYVCESDREVDLSFRFSHENSSCYVQKKVQWSDSKGEVRAYRSDFVVDNPALWWTHDLGDPALYQADLIVWQGELDGQDVQRIGFQSGIRTISLDQGKSEGGKHFRFLLNGVPVFMRGANYIPNHSFEAVLGKDRRARVLQAALDVNMNMLRVWGGGVYEDDAFYAWCDAHGVLVWQDFMFACAMYPGDAHFIDNVREEAAWQVRRLRGHPSVALWCGNNEVSEGWHRWGWQDGLSRKERKAVWKSYRHLFQKVLPGIVRAHSTLSYHESSPTLGRGDVRHTRFGDAHYWGVWHDSEPFSRFEERVPRFMSEFGFQSMPDLATMQSTWRVGRPDSSLQKVRVHQKHPRGFALMDAYMDRMLPPTDDTYRWAYQTQVVQKHGIVRGIRAHRAAQPYCMGTLYWQLNDCWPAISWSSVDVSGRWKALHHALKKAYASVSVWPERDASGQLQLRLVNDLLDADSTLVSFAVYDAEARSLAELQDTLLSVPTGSSVCTLPSHFVVSPGSVWHLRWQQGGETYELMERISADSVNWDGYKAPVIRYRTEQINAREWEVVLWSEGFAFDVQVNSSIPGSFDRNYFDLRPVEIAGETRLRFSSEVDIDELPVGIFAW